jgi:Carbon-nitrogen hydrolase
VQITAPMSPGSSGSPVMDAQSGEVLGIAILIYEGGQNLNFAIPAQKTATLMASATSSATVRRAELVRKTGKDVRLASRNQVGERSIYHKIQLLGSDLDHFTSGNEALFRSVRDVNFGILACCEPQVIFHINNAVKPADEIWKHLLLARGVENSVYVCSVNNANSPQALASYVIAPCGKILLKTRVRTEEVLTVKLDLHSMAPGSVVLAFENEVLTGC